LSSRSSAATPLLAPSALPVASPIAASLQAVVAIEVLWNQVCWFW
ncbi:unnamed protein product, partial [Urochloa humidicola]